MAKLITASYYSLTKPLWHCPTCDSNASHQNGTTRHGKQHDQCRDGGRQCVEQPQWRRMEEATKATMKRLLLETMPLAGMARSVPLSESWLQQYVNADDATVPEPVPVPVPPQAPQHFTVPMAALWSFGADQGKEQGVWLALAVQTRERVGCDSGDHAGESAQALWQSLSPVERQCALCDTAFWGAAPVALLSKRHRAVGKARGLTSAMERCNQTLHQRVARLVRKILACSKQLSHHSRAIWHFMHPYKEQRRRLMAAQNQRLSSVLA